MNSLALPTHVAIIPDGNRRWATQHAEPPIAGHQRGAETFRTIALYAADVGVRYLSVWGLSLHNFSKRQPQEVAGLLRLFREQFTKLATDEAVHSRQIRIQVIGKWQELFPRGVIKAISAAQANTQHYNNYTLTIFLAYNGTEEMREAIERIVAAARQDMRLPVTPELIKQNLYTAALPPVDLLIRTGGEPHLSAGFMMWDMADAALHFTPTYWPAFGAADFDVALQQYAAQGRRQGQ